MHVKPARHFSSSVLTSPSRSGRDLISLDPMLSLVCSGLQGRALPERMVVGDLSWGFQWVDCQFRPLCGPMSFNGVTLPDWSTIQEFGNRRQPSAGVSGGHPMTMMSYSLCWRARLLLNVRHPITLPLVCSALYHPLLPLFPCSS